MRVDAVGVIVLSGRRRGALLIVVAGADVEVWRQVVAQAEARHADPVAPRRVLVVIDGIAEIGIAAQVPGKPAPGGDGRGSIEVAGGTRGRRLLKPPVDRQADLRGPVRLPGKLGTKVWRGHSAEIRIFIGLTKDADKCFPIERPELTLVPDGRGEAVRVALVAGIVGSGVVVSAIINPLHEHLPASSDGSAEPSTELGLQPVAVVIVDLATLHIAVAVVEPAQVDPGPQRVRPEARGDAGEGAAIAVLGLAYVIGRGAVLVIPGVVEPSKQVSLRREVPLPLAAQLGVVVVLPSFLCVKAELGRGAEIKVVVLGLGGERDARCNNGHEVADPIVLGRIHVVRVEARHRDRRVLLQMGRARLARHKKPDHHQQG